MSYEMNYNPNTHTIEMNIRGNLSMPDVLAITEEVARIALEKNCFSILGDYRETTLNLSTLEIYEVPKIISGILASSGLDVQKFKRALVVKEDLDDFHFFESATINRGQNARIFKDIEKAKGWLSEE